MNLAFKLFLSSLVLIVLGQTSMVVGLRAVLGSAVEPLSFGARRFGMNLSDQVSFLKSLTGTLEENKRLREEIPRLKSELSRLKEFEWENSILREQLSTEVEGSPDLVAVRIRSWQDLSGMGIVLINGGENLGFKPGMTVLIKNFLLGRIGEVGKRTSKVRFILNPQLRVFALDQDSMDRARGVVRGFPPGKLLMERILPEEEVLPGDSIITSGEEEVPFGLILGRVEKVIPEEGEILKQAILRPELNFARLEEVFVLRY